MSKHPTRLLPVCAAVSLMLLGGLSPSAFAQRAGGGGSVTGPSTGAFTGPATSGAPAAPGSTAVNPFPTVPQTGFGSPQVPSAGNAEPNSSINQQSPLPGATPPASGSTANSMGANSTGTLPPATSPSDPTGEASRVPALDDVPLGSGGGSSRQGGASSGSSSGDAATDSSGSGIMKGTGADTRDRFGGGNGTREDCMKDWDAGTHMSKELWRETCRRLGQ